MSRRPMTPERMLAALVGEFGRSLVAISDLMMQGYADGPRVETTGPSLPPHEDSRLSESSTEHLRALWPPGKKRESKPTPLPKDEASSAPMRRAILISLAQFGRPMTPAQIGLYSGRAHKGGAFVSAFSDLKADGCVEGFAGKTYLITAAGYEELGDWARLPEGMALFEHWCSKLGPMADAILRCLLADPEPIHREVIGERTGKAYKGGAFVQAAAELQRMQLVEQTAAGLKLTDDLRRAVAPSVRVFDKSSNTHHLIDAHKGHVR